MTANGISFGPDFQTIYAKLSAKCCPKLSWTDTNGSPGASNTPQYYFYQTHMEDIQWSGRGI
jgi:hypothetical protein